jgi:Family of unknown function (DUF5681)
MGQSMASKKKTLDSYEVGYGKPPKDTQFQKGASGNPKGRPKKVLDFDHELIRESQSFITINDNGQRKRITKLEGIVKQLTNKAIAGSVPAARTYIGHYQQAAERIALAALQQASESGKYDDVNNLTDEELMWIAAGGDPKKMKK